MKNGFVSLIGAGPGDPGLITVKGRQRLQTCEAVVYDSLASEQLLLEVGKDCRKIYVGKRAGRHYMKQEEISRLLVELGKEGLTVARLKGGDPFVFGRGGEEIDALSEAGIPYEVIPGVTSAVAVPECAGIPVTHRGVSRSFHVITGHTRGENGGLPPEFHQLAGLSGTLVFLMGLGSLPVIVSRLLEAGREPSLPVAVIENGTMPGQRTVRGCLSDIVRKVEQAGLKTPAIIVAGEVAGMDLTCRRGLPLAGASVGITGTPSFRERLGGLLESLGARVSCAGSMEVRSFVKEDEVQRVYGNLGKYTMLVFTSANGVRLFFQGLLEAGKDYRSVGHMRIAAVGSGTAGELKRLGFLADLVPQTYCTRDLARLLAREAGKAGEARKAWEAGEARKAGEAGARDCLLIPRAKGGSPELAEILRQSEVAFDDVILYDVMGSARAGQTDGEVCPDYLTFASASGVEAFFDQKGEGAMEALSGLRTVCIGDVTARALQGHGRAVDVMAREYTVHGMAEAIIRDWSER